MTIKEDIKVMKAAKRLKKYCSKCECCEGCMFYDESPQYSNSCMIRQKNPEEYDLEKITRGLVSE